MTLKKELSIKKETDWKSGNFSAFAYWKEWESWFRREYITAAQFDKEISMDQPSKQMPKATVQSNARMTLD